MSSIQHLPTVDHFKGRSFEQLTKTLSNYTCQTPVDLVWGFAVYMNTFDLLFGIPGRESQPDAVH